MSDLKAMKNLAIGGSRKGTNSSVFSSVGRSVTAASGAATSSGCGQPKRKGDGRSGRAAAADRRKQRILKMEALRAKKSDRSELDEETEQQSLAARTAVEEYADEQLDDVKEMNRMVLYAQCMAVRDEQLKEKEEARRREREEELGLDRMMEESATRKQKKRDKRERRRHREQKRGAAEIVRQISQREHDRIRARQLKEQEAYENVQKMRREEEAEKKMRLKRAEKGKRLLEQILQSNQEAADQKRKNKDSEIEEDLRIAEYLRQKEIRDAERDAEESRMKKERELEITRLRARQEKAQDRRGELDNIRARRYQEAQERKWRSEQRRNRELRNRKIQDMNDARQRQIVDKERVLADQARAERAEFEHVLQWQRKQTDQEALVRNRKRHAAQVHRQELQKQIDAIEKAKERVRRSRFEEGKELVRQQEQEHARLERIKQRKLAELDRLGIPDKYKTELLKMRVMESNLTG